jgi:signal transduction histidine kinase
MRWWLAGWVAVAALHAVAQPISTSPRVLVLFSYRAGMRWTDSLFKGIRNVLEEPDHEFCDLRAEFMDTKRISSDEYFLALRDLYRIRYRPDEFDAIIACDDDAFNFLRKYRAELFDSTPVVFCGVNYFDGEMLRDFPHCTGVVEAYDLVSTLDVALKLHPSATKVFVINDDTATGVANRKRVDEIAPRYSPRVPFTHLHNMTMRELLTEVERLPADAVVLLMSFNRDKAGQEFRYRDAARLICSRSPVPVYGVWDFYMGYGIVGGRLTSGESQGKLAATLAKRILSGESADSIPVITESPNEYMFDYRQLTRWGVPISALPPGSAVRYEPRRQMEISRRTLYVAGAVFGVLLGLLTVLGIEIIQRQRAQKTLEEINQRLKREIREREETEKALRSSEEQIRQMQKLEALGRLAGGVAHDFNNLLTAIIGFGKLALDQLPADMPARADLEEVLRAAERAVGVTRQLLALGRRQMLQVQPVDLNKIVANMDRLLRHSLGEDVELVTVFGEDLPPVMGDPGYLEQVLLNLVVNARDAMPNGGKLFITTSLVELQPGRDGVSPQIKAGAYVQLEVRDTGCGMSPEVLQRAAEPFFTTKQPGEGTGLGLSVVFGIVRQLGGDVAIRSAPGEGCTVRVWLPAAPGAVVADTKSEAQRTTPRGWETILVVEDEDFVRRYFVRVLESLGYRVLEAANGHEALERYGAVVNRIDLVMTDIVMPGMSGRDLAKRFRALRRDQKILFVTGFSKEMAGRNGIGESEAILLKPVTSEKLAVKVRAVLDS